MNEQVPIVQSLPQPNNINNINNNNPPIQYQTTNTYNQQPLPKTNKKVIIGVVIAVFIISLFLIIWLVVLKTDGTWSDWGECVPTDDNTRHYSQTKKYIPAKWGGADLPLKEQVTPPIQTCGADGTYGNWVDSSKCQVSSTDKTTVECGPGKILNTRSYIPKIGNGVDIKPEDRILSQWADCNPRECKPVDGNYSDWVNGVCQTSKTDSTPITCGSGYMIQKRRYIPAVDHGIDIPANIQILSQWAPCNLPACPPKTDATCTPWVDDPAGCICISNKNAPSVYQIKQTRLYYPALNGGVDNTGDCAFNKERYILCDSNIPTSSTDTTPLNPNGTPGGICPSKAVFVDFPKIIDANCTPAKGSNRTTKVTATYTFPVGNNNSHEPSILNSYKSTDLDLISKLTTTQQPITVTNILDNIKVTWQRTNNIYPQTYILTKTVICADVPYYTDDQLNDIWTQYTGCNSSLQSSVWQDLGKKVSDVKLLKDSLDIQNIFDPYSKSKIISSLSTSDINRLAYCYQTPKKYLIITENDKYPITNSLYSGLIFNKPTSGNIILLRNRNDYPYFQLRFQFDGNIIYSYHSDKDNLTAIWESATYGKNSAMTLSMQFDGNLVAYDVNLKSIWNTASFNNPGIYLFMTPFGSLVWNNPNKSYKQPFIDPYNATISGITYKIFNSLNNNFPFPISSIPARTMINNESRQTLILLKNNNKSTFYLKFQEDGNLILTAGNTINLQVLWEIGKYNIGGVRMSVDKLGIAIRDVNCTELYHSLNDNSIENATTPDDYLTMTRAGNLIWGNSKTPFAKMFRQYYNLAINDINYKCYNSENFTTVRSFISPNKLFSNDLNSFNILVNDSDKLENGYREMLNVIKNNDFKNYSLRFQTDENLVLYRNGSALWHSETSDGNVVFLLITQNNGLQLYDDTLTQQKKNYADSRSDNLVLSPHGQLYFTSNTNYNTTKVNKPDNNPDGGQGTNGMMGIFDVTANKITSVIWGGDTLNLLNNSNEGDRFVKHYIENEFYYNSPWTLFVDKAGRAFKCLWGTFNQEKVEVFNGGYKPDGSTFRGYAIQVSDDRFKVQQRDLQSVYGYNVIIENVRPVADGKSGFNYNNSDNLKGFNGEQWRKQLPPQFGQSGTKVSDAIIIGGANVNCIPGYTRISTTNSEDIADAWLVSNNTNNAAFCLFHKFSDRDAFYKDLVKYNPNLVKKIYDSLGLTPGIQINTY